MKLRCVIVDDEFLARKRLLKLLESYQNILVVAECRNGKEALEKIALKEPDFIFLDIQMPDMDGLALTREIRYRYSKDEVSVIALSGEANKKVISKF